VKNTKYLVIVFIIILALVMTACGTEEEINIPEEDIEETVEKYEAADGGTLKLAVTRFNTLNPLLNKNYSLFQIHHLIYEGLVTFDENMEIKPLLAQDWNKSTDGQSLQLTLRQDVNWHDGKPFTAEDVIFTINLIKGNINGNSVFKGSLQQITDVREIQNGVINITFSKPFSNSLEVMTFPILPKHLFDGNDINKLKSPDFPLVGTGSYKLYNYETMRSIQLSRNDTYWGQKPYIEKIDITIFPDYINYTFIRCSY
jgi:peptide/nickel transport system substrate-binding protein